MKVGAGARTQINSFVSATLDNEIIFLMIIHHYCCFFREMASDEESMLALETAVKIEENEGEEATEHLIILKG